VGSGDRTLQVWDAAEWKWLVQLPQMAGEPVTGAAFSPDGESLAFLTAGENERAVRVWRTEFAPEPKEGDPNAPRLRNGRRSRVRSTCGPASRRWRWPGRKAREPPQRGGAHGSDVRGLHRQDGPVLNNTGNFLQTLNGHRDWVYAVAVSPTG
jgi:WD40 repeat protein